MAKPHASGENRRGFVRYEKSSETPPGASAPAPESPPLPALYPIDAALIQSAAFAAGLSQ